MKIVSKLNRFLPLATLVVGCLISYLQWSSFDQDLAKSKKIRKEKLIKEIEKVNRAPSKSTSPYTEEEALENRKYFRNFVDRKIESPLNTFEKIKLVSKMNSDFDFYHSVMNEAIRSAIVYDERVKAKELFLLAATVAKENTSLEQTAKETLKDLMHEEILWDEGLYRSAMQLYYVQGIINEKNNLENIDAILDDTRESNLKLQIIKINKEYNGR